ncbi:hypothetical protein ACFL1T_02870 [Chlamydiota bacterium]
MFRLIKKRLFSVMRIFLIAVFFLCSISVKSAQLESNKPYQTSSKLFPIIVTAQDSEDVVSIVRMTETVLPIIMSVFKIKTLPFKRIKIVLDTKKHEDTVWNVQVISRYRKDVFYGSTDHEKNKKLLLRSIIRQVLYGFIYRSGSDTEETIVIPRWLEDGLLVKLIYTKDYYFSFIQNKIKKETVPDKLVKLIENQGFGFFYEALAGSLIDYILELSNAHQKLRIFFDELGKEKDQSKAFFSAFREDFNTINELQEKWKQFLCSEHVYSFRTLYLTQKSFLEQLERILLVDRTTVINQSLVKKKLLYDFRVLKKMSKDDRKIIITEKIVALQNILIRSKPEHSMCVKWYIRCLEELQKNKTRNFLRFFKRAAKYKQMIKKSNDYK